MPNYYIPDDEQELNENNEQLAEIYNEESNVIGFTDHMEQGKFNVDYIVDKDRRVVGVSHPDWPFTIMRNQDNKTETAIVCSNTDEPFGVLDSDVFNTILMCWLLIDDPKLIDDAAQDAT